MSITKWLLVSLIAIIVTSVIGCGTAAPTPAPLPTQPPVQVTVIITATPPPPTATSPAAPITPLPTLPLTTTLPGNTPVTQPTSGATTATKPAAVATKKPTVAAVTTPPSPTALPVKFGAPGLNRPIWTDNEKDEVQYYGGAIVFDWKSVGGLGMDECYLVQVRTEAVNPGPAPQSDYWLTNCGDQTQTGYSVKFTLESPNRVGTVPNYSSIIMQNASQMWAHWAITVVKNLGQCDSAYSFHCKWAPISPTSTNYFLFKGS